MAEAGKAAVIKAASSQMESLTDRLDERAESLRQLSVDDTPETSAEPEEARAGEEGSRGAQGLAGENPSQRQDQHEQDVPGGKCTSYGRCVPHDGNVGGGRVVAYLRLVWFQAPPANAARPASAPGGAGSAATTLDRVWSGGGSRRRESVSDG